MIKETIHLLTEAEKLSQFRLDGMILPYELIVTGIVIGIVILFWRMKRK